MLGLEMVVFDYGMEGDYGNYMFGYYYFTFLTTFYSGFSYLLLQISRQSSLAFLGEG